MRLVVLVVVVLGIAVAAVWIAAARAVVPGVSATIYPIHYREGIARVAEQYHLDPYWSRPWSRRRAAMIPEPCPRPGRWA